MASKLRASTLPAAQVSTLDSLPAEDHLWVCCSFSALGPLPPASWPHSTGGGGNKWTAWIQTPAPPLCPWSRSACLGTFLIYTMGMKITVKGFWEDFNEYIFKVGRTVLGTQQILYASAGTVCCIPVTVCCVIYFIILLSHSSQSISSVKPQALFRSRLLSPVLRTVLDEGGVGNGREW